MLSSKKASDYEITADCVVNHIKNTFDRGKYVSESLRTLVKADIYVWKLTLKIVFDTDVNIK